MSIGWKSLGLRLDGRPEREWLLGLGSGFDCAYAGSTGVAVPDGTYTWVFDLEMDSGALFTARRTASSIKARYVGRL